MNRQNDEHAFEATMVKLMWIFCLVVLGIICKTHFGTPTTLTGWLPYVPGGLIVLKLSWDISVYVGED